MPPASGPIRVAPKRVRRSAPAPRRVQPSGIFGPLGRADAPITNAQHVAHKAERRAANRLPSRPQLLAPPPIQTVGQARSYVREQGRRLKAVGVHEGHVARTGPNRNADPFDAIYANSDAHDRAVLDHYRAVIKALFSHDQSRLLNGQVAQLRKQGMSDKAIGQRLGYAMSGIGNPRAVAGQPHHRLHLPGATIDLTNAAYHVRNTLAGNPLAAFISGTAQIGAEAAQQLRSVHASNKHFWGRGLNDFIDVPVLTIPTLAQTAKGLVDYASGAPGGAQEATAIAHGFTDPFVHPGRSFNQHPLMTLLAWRGVEAALGRGITRARGGAPARPDLRVYDAPSVRAALEGSPAARAHGTPIYRPQSYSGDFFEQALQQTVERMRTRRGQNPHEARGARARALLYGGSELGHSLADRGMLPRTLLGRTKPGLVDQFAGDWEVLRRFAAQQHVSHFRAIGDQVDKVLGKHASDAIPLFAEGVLTDPHIGGPMEAQIHAEIARLADAQAFGQHSMRDMHGGVELEGEHARANAENIQQLQGLLENPRFLQHPEPAIAAAHEYVKFSSDMEGELARLGGILPEQTRAKLFPVAQKHGGAVTSVEAAHRLATSRAMLEHYTEKAATTAPGSVEHEDAVQHIAAFRQEVRLWGRHHVGDQHAIEQAQAEVHAAKQALREASAEHARSGRIRSEQIGAQRVRRGQALHDEARKGKAKAGQRKVDRAGETADEARTVRQQAEKAFKEAKDQLEEARQRADARAISGLRKENGQPWTTAELEELAHEVTGGRGVGYLNHDLPSEWRSSVFSRTSTRPGTARFRRTGETFRQGAYGRSFDTLLHQVYDTANRVTGHRRANSIASRFGVGRFGSEQEAKAAADQLNGSTEAAGMRFEPHLIGPDQTLGIADPVSAEAVVPEGTPAAFRETNLEGPKWTLLPDAVAKRIGEHDKIATRDPGLLEWYTNRWRNASLFTSPRWFLGNPQEYAIRLAANDVTPLALAGRGRAARVGSVAVDEWRRAAADESLPDHVRDSARSNIAMYEAGTHYGSLAANIAREDELPWAHTSTAPRALVGAWLKWKNEILGPAMKRMEHGQLQGMIGREALREVGGFTRHWGGLTNEFDAQVRAWARGKLDPNKSAELGQRIMSAAGNWTHLTPGAKRAVQGLTPFGLWWVNSLRFIYGTLPAKHPFKTAIVAALELGQQQQLEQLGQGTTAEGEPHLQGGIHFNLPIVGGVTAHPTYYSPMGIATEPGKTAIDMIGPQFSDPGLTTIGVNPLTFQPRTTQDANGVKRTTTFWENLLGAINALGEGATPLARQAHQLIDQGATPLGTNTLPSEVLALAHLGRKQIKPGTERGMLSTLAKILSPVRYFYDPRQQGGASFGSGGGGGSSSGGTLTPAQQQEIDRAASAAAQGITPAQQRELDRAAGVSP